MELVADSAAEDDDDNADDDAWLGYLGSDHVGFVVFLSCFDYGLQVDRVFLLFCFSPFLHTNIITKVQIQFA